MEIVAIEGKAFEQLKQRFDDFTRQVKTLCGNGLNVNASQSPFANIIVKDMADAAKCCPYSSIRRTRSYAGHSVIPGNGYRRRQACMGRIKRSP